MSVAVIEREWSVTSMIDACSTGTATVFSGLATATASAAAAARYSAIGTCRRQRGRRGATAGTNAGLANASWRAPRRRWEMT